MQSLIQTEFPEARLLHRLDFGTSGILVFGFSKTAQELLTQAEKFYFCMVEGQLSKQGLAKQCIATQSIAKQGPARHSKAKHGKARHSET